MAVFESPSILLFNEKVVSHWLLFYARKSFHLPFLIAVECTKFSYYYAYLLSTHLLYLSSRACKCMLIFQHGGYCAGGRMLSSTDTSSAPWTFCVYETQHCHLSHKEIWYLLFKCRFFSVPSCVDSELMHITFIPGQQDKKHSGCVPSLCRPFTSSLTHSSAVGSRGMIHTVLAGRGTKTFPHHKLDRNIKGIFQLSGSQTSC